MKRFLLLLLSLCLMLSCFTFATFAADYNTTMPSYVPYSGGAFFEVFDSTLGKVTCIFPIDFQNGAFGFNNSGTNIYNLTNSTINGYIVTSGGAVYTARANRFTYVEYRTSSTVSTYTALNPDMSTLTSTNINFITDDPELYNDSYFDKDNLIIALLSILCICEASNVLISLFRRGYRL